jgi:pilus assembly protein CpaB
MVFLALLSGASMAVGVMRSNRANAKGVADGLDIVAVVVAAVDVPRATQLTAEHVRLCDWPKGLVPKGAVMKLEEAIGHVTVGPVLAEELILQPKLTSKQAKGELATLVPVGMRAYTIQASRVASNVAGFILPGNQVDVLLNLRGSRDDETGGGSTTTLLQAVEVLAVDQRLEGPEENKKVDLGETSSVTLLVSPKQAALLDLGQNMGQMTLSLRNPEDTAEAVTEPTTVADIRFRQEKPLDETPTAAVTPVETPAAEARPPEKPAALGIVTLRGTLRGRVNMTSQ